MIYLRCSSSSIVSFCFILLSTLSASRDSRFQHWQISTCLACPSESNKFKIQVISTKTWNSQVSLALWATLSDLRGETLCQKAIAESQAWQKSHAWLIHHHSSNSSVWNDHQSTMDHEHQIVAKILRHSLVHLPNFQYYLHEIASTSIDGYRFQNVSNEHWSKHI